MSDQTLEHNTVAVLRLQQIQPLCDKAIEQFLKLPDIQSNVQVRSVDQSRSPSYAWIDSTLFVDTLVSLLTNISICQHTSTSTITISLRQIGSSRCQVLLSNANSPDLSTCEGPFDIDMLDEPSLNPCSIKSIVTMHGGSVETWKKAHSSDTIFEINLICMSYNDGGCYDYLEA